MIKEAIGKIVERENLSEEEARKVMDEIMEGKATSAQIGSFLTALRMKGETGEEISGLVKGMMDKRVSFSVSHRFLADTCGTGGDGKKTFNVSTCTAFVVAGAGVPVAKHGNRALSSSCGSADVLEALGARIDLPPEGVRECIEETGFGFLFAPLFHPAMKYALGPRREMGIRTVFNILGPLANPLSARIRILGVFHPRLLELLPRALITLGVKRAYLVYGEEGLDEVSLGGRTEVLQIKEGREERFSVFPEDFGLRRRVGEKLIRGGSPERNARILKSVLEGEKGPFRDMVLLNSSLCLMAAEKAKDFKEGVKVAQESIDSGRAKEKLEHFVKFTQGWKSYAGEGKRI